METKNIYTKLFEIQNKGLTLKENKENPFFKSKYVTLDEIIKTFNPLFNESKILCYHYTKEDRLVTCLYDIEGESKIESEFHIHNTDPQKQGSEISYGKRYNLGQLLNIQIDKDDDGNLASSDGNTKKYYDKEAKQDKPTKWYNDVDKNIDTWKDLVVDGKTTPQGIIDKIEADGYTINKANKTKILNLG